MKYTIFVAAVALSVAGCANQYSDLPEPRGEWSAANLPPVVAPVEAAQPTPRIYRRWLGTRQARQ